MSYLDMLPSNERSKLRNALRSPEAYERLRERVKGPADLEKELRRSERMAEAHLALESNPEAQKSALEKITLALREEGPEYALETAADAKEKHRILSALENGAMKLTIASHPVTHEDALVLLPEGRVAEKLPLSASFSDAVIASLLGHA